jgi:hypothetical protein
MSTFAQPRTLDGEAADVCWLSLSLYSPHRALPSWRYSLVLNDAGRSVSSPNALTERWLNLTESKPPRSTLPAASRRRSTRGQRTHSRTHALTHSLTHSLTHRNDATPASIASGTSTVTSFSCRMASITRRPAGVPAASPAVDVDAVVCAPALSVFLDAAATAVGAVETHGARGCCTAGSEGGSASSAIRAARSSRSSSCGNHRRRPASSRQAATAALRSTGATWATVREHEQLAPPTPRFPRSTAEAATRSSCSRCTQRGRMASPLSAGCTCARASRRRDSWSSSVHSCSCTAAAWAVSARPAASSAAVARAATVALRACRSPCPVRAAAASAFRLASSNASASCGLHLTCFGLASA